MEIGDKIRTNQSDSMIHALKGQTGIVTDIKPLTKYGPQSELKYCVKLDQPVNNGLTDIFHIGLEAHMIDWSY